MAGRLKPGDVDRFDTPAGAAFVQYMGKYPLHGQLVRVLPGLFSEQPDLEALAQGETNFWVFHPVGHTAHHGYAEHVGHAPIPEHSRQPPLFRTGVAHKDTGKVETWWFWDAVRNDEWMVGDITEEERKFPIRGNWNDTLLIERMAAEWRPERDPR